MKTVKDFVKIVENEKQPAPLTATTAFGHTNLDIKITERGIEFKSKKIYTEIPKELLPENMMSHTDAFRYATSDLTGDRFTFSFGELDKPFEIYGIMFFEIKINKIDFYFRHKNGRNPFAINILVDGEIKMTDPLETCFFIEQDKLNEVLITHRLGQNL